MEEKTNKKAEKESKIDQYNQIDLSKRKEEKKKSFLRRHEIAIVVIITLVLIYAVVFLNQKINFFLGNEMIVYLEPQQRSVKMHYSNQSFISFDVHIENSANCVASCEYRFLDQSLSSVVDEGTFKISKNEYYLRNYTITAKRTGSGQDIYSFDVTCKSIASIICLTNSKQRQRSSLLTVDYHLSSEEQALKETLKKKIELLLLQLKEADESFQELSNRHFELGKKINLKDSIDEKTKIENDLNNIVLSTEGIRAKWSLEDYQKINSLLDDSYFSNITLLKNSISTLNEKINQTLQLHNQLLHDLEVLSGKINVTSKNSNAIGKNNEHKTPQLVIDFDKIADEITNNTFENYSYAIQKVIELNGKSDSALFSMQKESYDLSNEINYIADYENRLLCSLSNCTYNPGFEETSKTFMQNYPHEELKCSELDNIKSRISIARNDTMNYINKHNIILPSTPEFSDSAFRVYENKKIELNNSIIDELNLMQDSQLKASISIIAPSAKVALLNVNETYEMRLYLLSKINVSDVAKFTELNSKCSLYSNPTNVLNDFDYSSISDQTVYKITQRINTTLADNPPMCCVFGKCQPCCVNDDCKNENYPVIFLHGHSFVADNSPEFSLDAFNKIQSKLQDDGYINAGIVSIYSKNDENSKGAWGLSGRPITVKASYYYDSIRQDEDYIVVPTKSESIDTYALRLKDIISVVKQRTGKEKVNIVAHSMGGLVARRYMQVFGDTDVERLIMIATPNKGITGKINNVCNFIGENLECRDMGSDSIFMNKLNDPQNQPHNTKIFNIIGTGCKVNNKDADGVVESENVQMPDTNNFYMGGQCESLGSPLHTELLDIDKYTSTYEIIRDALKV